MLARSQTMEDMEPHRFPLMSLHHEYTTYEFVRYVILVRCPWKCTDFSAKLVIRDSQTSTRVTCALEVLRTE